MLRQPVSSSSIASIGYAVGLLEVQFNHGGIYQFFGVPPQEHMALVRAGSKGQHFNRAIKGRYPFWRLPAGSP